VSLLVLDPGPFTTVQDLGRRGQAHLGVPRSGAADRGSLRLANRLVGNDEPAAALEVLAGGAALEAQVDLTVAVSGARCEVAIDGRQQGRHVAVAVAAGQVLSLGPAVQGLRVYLAVRGGLAVPPVLGSRSYDQLGALGPPPLRADDVLQVGDAARGEPSWEPLPAADPPHQPVLRVVPGPRDDWLLEPGLDGLTAALWTVDPASDRAGTRLTGPPIARREGDLASEGTVPGAVQLPPDGRPILLGPDAGVTGGYPVVAVVVDADLDLAGQLAPGTKVRFRTR
jgi:biotin-dependent carboxylase-like uncharacterized protein